MSNIAKALQELRKEIPETVTLVAVSKFHPNEAIMEAYEAGQRIFGESKIQEMVAKYEDLPKDIEWHMIGHVQRNKVKYMASFVSLIHGVDSPRLLKEINKQAQKNDRIIDCLLQMYIAEEDTKFGFDYEELCDFVASDEFKAMKNIRIKGLMGMATYTDDTEQIKREFNQLKTAFSELKNNPDLDFEILSMGMSGDYPLAIECGSTMVRIGSKIFGERQY